MDLSPAEAVLPACGKGDLGWPADWAEGGVAEGVLRLSAGEGEGMNQPISRERALEDALRLIPCPEYVQGRLPCRASRLLEDFWGIMPHLTVRLPIASLLS